LDLSYNTSCELAQAAYRRIENTTNKQIESDASPIGDPGMHHDAALPL
jgi:hypothetical protein